MSKFRGKGKGASFFVLEKKNQSEFTDCYIGLSILPSYQLNSTVLRSDFRENWGLKGVLENLFRLWYNNTHPISMIELMHPHKQKLAAALAFYSIMGKKSNVLFIHSVSNKFKEFFNFFFSIRIEFTADRSRCD